MTEIPQQKLCTKCHVSKNLDEFYRQRAGLYGRTASCKACEKIRKTLLAAKPKTVVKEKTCTKCGVTKLIEEFDKQASSPDGRSPRCKACVKTYNASRANHPKIVVEEKRCSTCKVVKPINQFNNSKAAKDRHAAFCKACQKVKNDANKESRQAAYFATQEVRKQYAKNYYRENEPKLKVQKTAWFFDNREKVYADNRAWHKAHPTWEKERKDRRRAKKAGALRNDLTHMQWEEIKVAFNYRCAYCPIDCQACKKKTHILSRDHIDPIFYGGNHTVHNIVPACISCNSKKSIGPPLVPVQPLLLTISPPKPLEDKTN